MLGKDGMPNEVHPFVYNADGRTNIRHHSSTWSIAVNETDKHPIGTKFVLVGEKDSNRIIRRRIISGIDKDNEEEK